MRFYFEQRFSTFRKAIDAEMREANKMGMAQATKKPERGAVTEEEELELWRQSLLGGHSAESLLHTLYFYTTVNCLACVQMSTDCCE